MSKILIIEDDDKLAELFESILHAEGFTTFVSYNATDAIKILENEYLDLIITDIMMPEIDGFELIQMIRQFNKEIPILVVTAKDSYQDKKTGFDIGADDYMVKPIDVKELVLRVEALLRRAKIVNSNILEVNNVVLNQNTFSITIGSDKTSLPQKEFLLLHKLLSYPEQIFTRQQLMEQIWGPSSDTDERTVDVHIKRIRDRFPDQTEFTITTVRGLGYKAEI